MAQGPEFDLSAAHKYFSAQCFNKTWELLDKADRTPEEDQDMIRTALASMWHWTQRDDCGAQQMSVGYWQVSRVYAALGLADPARHYGRLCLEASDADDVGPFFVGYAYEALARAEWIAGNAEKKQEYLEEARKAAESVDDADSKKMLLDDLATMA
jgi:hypothetical protein